MELGCIFILSSPHSQTGSGANENRPESCHIRWLHMLINQQDLIYDDAGCSGLLGCCWWCQSELQWKFSLGVHSTSAEGDDCVLSSTASSAVSDTMQVY